jgi:genome maintenance exonuclease 1
MQKIKKVTGLKLHSQAEGDRVYIDDDGELYISNTSLLSKYEDKTGLDKWIAKLGVEEAERQRDAASERGTLSHTEVEYFLTHNKLPENVSKFSKVAIDGFYSSTEIVEMEGLVGYNDGNVRFAGRFDQLLRIKSGSFRYIDSTETLPDKLLLCDLKTKAKAPNLEFAYMFKHLLQSSAYVVAKELSDDISIDGVAIIFASPQTCKQVYLSRENIEYYWNVFYSLMEDYYKVKPLDKSWARLIAGAEYCWDKHLSAFVPKTPTQIIKIPVLS